MNAIIATTPQGMQEAQATTALWVEHKIERAKAELAEVEETRAALVNVGASTVRIDRLIAVSVRRVRFYEKVKAALSAGYVIIPPFAVQAFAIRVPERSSPRADYGEHHWTNDVSMRQLPVGEGKYVSPVQVREKFETIQKPRSDDPSKTREIAIYQNRKDWMRVDIPVIAQKPKIIEAVRGAMEKMIFDALGIAPSERSADPIIVGQIKHWRNRRAEPMTFFVAWWLDERDL